MSVTQTSIRLLVSCIKSAECDVSFEPEGAVVKLAHGDAFTVQIQGPGEGVVEVSYEPNGLIIGAWKGARTEAWDRSGRRLQI
jgi:hypothetical protein